MRKLASWITVETNATNFGDKRLDQRFVTILNSLVSASNQSILVDRKTWKETLAPIDFLTTKM